ncbi:ATP-binding protein [Hyalangium versicolor]|uniref:ATP-binding protein n=1 Tax=Hyalangium versicolor TaxID=2861190 RepID=UPI001CCB5B10|nr:ATP-binding protein [Hyalangium versicolor]
MTSTVAPESISSRAEAPGSQPPRSGQARWLLARLDSLLSKELRQASPSQLARHRVLAGACSFILLLHLVALVLFPLSRLSLVTGGLSLCYSGILLLLRRARSHLLPSLSLCLTMAFGSTLIVFSSGYMPYAGTHAAHMLLPAFAVYLLGARRGFFITLIICINSGLIYPLYYSHFRVGPQESLGGLFWPFYVASTLSFLGAWALDSLQSASQREAQVTLEQTLSDMRDHEDKLSSLIDSTDDLVASLDTEGRLLAFNSAIRGGTLRDTGYELTVGQLLFPESNPAVRALWMPRLALALQGERQRYEEVYEGQGGPRTFDISVNPTRGAGGRITGMTLFARDITARKQAEARLGELHRTLVDVSRQAGMAEIATGVLHNVGNTLTSVNVSTTLVIDRLRQSRLSGLGKANALIQEHADHLGQFLSEDPQGQKLPGYLIALFSQLQAEHDTLLQEMLSLRRSVDHIKSIVSMQQKHARIAGAVEEVPVPQLIDEALRLHAASFERMGIHLERDYANVPTMLVDRHRLLQILVNLLSNARDALVASETQDKRLRISIHMDPEAGSLRIQVSDNGLGITPENLPRMFAQGFTTKKHGHGFGLHISALAAMEMKGRLTCSSPGPGQGSTFTLELPMEETHS